ncbi:MAG: 3-hydroxyacyl-CoA dehydrogenase family protein [Terriglobales bacterium]
MAGAAPEVRTIAVISAGRTGRAIAQLAAQGGYRTILEDLLPNALRRAETEIHAQLDRAVESGNVSADAAQAAISRLEFAGTVEEAARQADLVIELVPEELESKIEIFTLLDKICRPGTILASQLSSLSITEISRVTYRAGNCLGMRFEEPVDTRKRLELIRSPETDDDTVAAAVEVGKRLGKGVMVITESK